MSSQTLEKGFNIFVVAFQVNLHSLLAIQNPALQRIRESKPIYEWAEADSLYNPPDSNGAGSQHAAPFYARDNHNHCCSYAVELQLRTTSEQFQGSNSISVQGVSSNGIVHDPGRAL